MNTADPGSVLMLADVTAERRRDGTQLTVFPDRHD